MDDPEQAEVLIVNTCAFIEPAIEEAVDALLELADLKQSGRLRALICSGCLTQRGGEELLEQLPEVDVFLAPGAVPRVVEAVEAALAGRRQVMLDAQNLPVLRRDAALAVGAGLVHVRQDRRRVRQPVLVLHGAEPARGVSE